MKELWIKDSAEKQINIGDIIKLECDNEDVHGEWCYYEVINRGGFPIISYLMSDKGYILPPDYTASHLSTFYSAKSLVWVSPKYIPMPCESEMYVISESELPFPKITVDDWSKIKDEERKVRAQQREEG